MQKQQHIPTITDTISLPFITEIAIAPDGKHVAYVVRTADWTVNEYVLTCFVHDINHNDPRKIADNVRGPRWLDNDTLVVLHRDAEDSTRFGEKAQALVFPHADAYGTRITSSPSGVEKFWCYGNGIIYLADTSSIAGQEHWGEDDIHVSHASRTS